MSVLNILLQHSYNLQIAILLAVGFVYASILGYVALRFKVSPILGYLLAGYLIGPYSPGFVADKQTSEQLAEIGVILMMFGVGLDFRIQELIKVKSIAIPGAIVQTLVATALSTYVVHLFGASVATGVLIGLAIGVASTVVLVQMLAENHLMKTEEGHIAVGWLIVEDVITMLILLLLPSLSSALKGEEVSLYQILTVTGIALAKFVALIFLLGFFVQKIINFILTKVRLTRSHELFTLAILAMIFVIAIASTVIFGISIALGAFIVGVIIRQTAMHHKALVHSLPLKDAFIAFFFISIGMLFNPAVIVEAYPIFLSILAIILIAKPLTAFLITIALKYPLKAALVISTALAQIGEFSFILSEEAMRLGFFSDNGYDLIVACAIISIGINPLIFKFLRNKNWV